MNYFSHYFLDKDNTDSLFFVGVATPDLISTFNRSYRLKANRMPLLMENDASRAEISFYNGVMRHFEVDRIFHTSSFFRRETELLTRILQDTFGPENTPRAFFVSHILLELILDRILIVRHSSLLYSFYRHFETKDVGQLVELTEWVARRRLPGYSDFLKRFAEKQFLYNYSHWDFLIDVTFHILKKVGVGEAHYLRSNQFLAMIHSYESSLSRRVPKALEELSQMLSNKTYYSTE